MDRELIKFLRLLFDVNSDINGFVNKAQQDRIERWMDAVLPPDIEFEISNEAAEAEGGARGS